ncbi:MAG: hypothetical protein LJE95_12905 [Acidobacteria bacterium]|jgi:hypothetical protein|nr:hypothetical protein [Acidobacteriota bacterium]
MSFEPVPKTRTKIRDDPDGLLLVIPARIEWFAAVLLVVWLGGWAVGEVSVLRQVLHRSPDHPVSAFLTLWLIGWTVGGLAAGAALLWMLVGEERVLLRPDSLVIHKNILGIGRRRKYDLASIRRLRVTGPDSSRSSSGAGGSGWIAFDHGSRTIRFGQSVDAAEAFMLLEALKQRYPFPDDAASRVEA